MADERYFYHFKSFLSPLLFHVLKITALCACLDRMLEKSLHCRQRQVNSNTCYSSPECTRLQITLSPFIP